MAKPRLDIFILFSGPGIANKRQILSLIRQEMPILAIKNFKIDELVFSHSEQVRNMASLLTQEQAKPLILRQFVESIYEIDAVPIEHLRAKTRYLLDLPTLECVVVVVRNKEPDEQLVGEGEFQHIQCLKMKALKDKIRQQFNPRNPDGSKSEFHVLHSTDYLAQTEYLLKYFGLTSIHYFNRVPNEDFNLSFHVDVFDHYEIREVDIDSIRFNLADRENVKIEDSPHYKYLQGQKTEYEDYTNDFVGVKDYSDHCPETFDKLLAEFDYSSRNYILVRPYTDWLHCVDGNHRVCIAKHLGYKKIKVVVMNPPIPCKVDMGWLFQNLPHRTIVLRKSDTFPAYYPGSDVDLLTDMPDKCIAAIVKFARLCKVQKLEIAEHGPHLHADFYFDNVLDIRFDIVSTLSDCGIPDSKIGDILAHAVPEQCGGLTAYVPDYLDDLVLRFAEWRQNPVKVKHLRHIMTRLNDGVYPALKEYLDIDMDKAGFEEILQKAGLA